MATFYIWSGATGSGSGADFTNAFTTLAAAITTSANGDTLLVASDHSESVAATTTYTVKGTYEAPGILKSVNRTTGNYEAGASWDITGTGNDLTLAGQWFGFGLSFKALDIFYFNSGSHQVFRDCTFILSTSGRQFETASQLAKLVFINCVFDRLSTGTSLNNFFAFGQRGPIDFFGCEFLKAGSSVPFCNSTVETIRCFGCKFVNISNVQNTVNNNSIGSQFVIDSCEVASGFTVGHTGVGSVSRHFTIVNSINGTITGPLSKQIDRNHGCETTENTDKYRDGGATINSINYSLQMTNIASAIKGTTAGAFREIVLPVTSGSKTVKILLAGDTTLDSDDLFVDLYSPAEGGSPTAKPRRQTSKLATVANLSTDTVSTWTGTSVGTKQKIEFSINPAVPGLMRAMIWFSKPSGTVYVCPKIDVV